MQLINLISKYFAALIFLELEATADTYLHKAVLLCTSTYVAST